MKRTCILAIIAMAISVNAATIKWGATGQTKYGSTTLTTGKATIYLVYLGENVSDWSSWSYSSDFSETKVGSTSTTGLGTVTVSSTILTPGNAIGGLDHIGDTFASGKSSFGILYTTTQEGKDYYYQGGTFTYDTSSTSYNAAPDMYTYTSSSAPNANASWTPVPEPSTAALALAGLALLLKRRKA